MKMRLVILLMETDIIPALIISPAASSSAFPIPSRHSRPFFGSAATAPKAAQESKEATPLIHQYTLAQMVEYVNTVSAQELDFIKEAYKVNYELLQEGLKSPKTTYGPYLLKKNGGVLVYSI